MKAISEETFKFMADLWENNNKAWFDENRKRYEEYVRKPMKTMAELLSDPVSEILPEFSGKPSISRINNDIRFTPHKPPYKEHVWISFSKGSSCLADIFVAIGRKGWAAGCGIGAPRKEPLDRWRQNLLKFQDLWRRYAEAIKLGKEVNIFINDSYKKHLFPEIPEDLKLLVQAKSVWLVEEPRWEFNDNTGNAFFSALCRFLPIFLFMEIPVYELPGRLAELGGRIKAPDKEVGKVWTVLKY